MGRVRSFAAELPAELRGAARGMPSILLLCASLLAPAPALAEQTGTTADDLARRHFESGAAYLEESDYDNALRAFEKAYELSKRPEILLNIASLQERRGNVAGAISALKDYLAVAPNGQHAETAQLRIQNLERRLPKPENDSPAPPVVTPPAPAPEPVAPAPPPHPHHTGAFVALGVGVGSALGALVTGILAKAKYDDANSTCRPDCSDSRLAQGRTLAVTSTVLTGVAIVGAGLGVTLLIVERPAHQGSTGSSLKVAVSPEPNGAVARASWSF